MHFFLICHVSDIHIFILSYQDADCLALKAELGECTGKLRDMLQETANEKPRTGSIMELRNLLLQPAATPMEQLAQQLNVLANFRIDEPLEDEWGGALLERQDSNTDEDILYIPAMKTWR